MYRCNTLACTNESCNYIVLMWKVIMRKRGGKKMWMPIIRPSKGNQFTTLPGNYRMSCCGKNVPCRIMICLGNLWLFSKLMDANLSKFCTVWKLFSWRQSNSPEGNKNSLRRHWCPATSRGRLQIRTLVHSASLSFYSTIRVSHHPTFLQCHTNVSVKTKRHGWSELVWAWARQGV